MAAMKMEEPLVFSTKCDNLRYVVTCIINQDAINLVDTIVDTGAMYTCYKAELINEELKEEGFLEADMRYIGGFVEGSNADRAVKFYEYEVAQFTIGTVDLGKQKIWVTFDDRISDNVLGMDMLHKTAFLQFEKSNRLYFFNDRMELAKSIDAIISEP